MPGQDYQVRMKLKVLSLILTLNISLIMSAESFGIVVHGGAGVLSGLSTERQQEIENKVKDTLISAYKILEDGGSSMDAVEFAVSEFEDSTLFNAGKGSVYNSNEVQEMDASIMNGADRSAGAVASVQIIKNPIKLARKVLEETDHVLLVGHGAEIFAKDIEETQGQALNFPLLADANRKVSELYGMIHPKADDTFTVRSVFIIDSQKKLRLSLTYPASTGRNFTEILRVLDSLQLTDSHKVATPVNWKSGEDVIIVPTLSNDEATKLFPKGFREIKPYLRTTPCP